MSVFRREKKLYILPKDKRKQLRKFFRKITKKETLVKIIILFVTIVLIATSILPYVI